MTVEWEDPPAAPTGAGRYDDLRAACRANPKRWAVLGRDFKSSNSTAQGIKRRSKETGVWAGPWEVTARGTTVWVRWMGDPEP